jgi:glycosyltransferase involved in cell wall biosynthesis
LTETLLAIAVASAIGLAWILARLALWGLTAPRLRAATLDLERWPSVSVVIAGRNEERNVGEALQSVLALDYPELEVVFVNDRSTDRTGAIVRELAGGDPRLRLLDVGELPAGWLGKNHALHQGASDARGELILFTDADVVFDPSTLSRAVYWMLALKLDHLTSGFTVTAPTLRLRLFVAAFSFYFMLYARPWGASNPRSSAYIGIGGFNLVRAEHYRAAGGHEPIAMRPDDDMMLGKLMKKSGGRQALADPAGLIRVEWYPSLREAARGFEKNAFAGLEYSVVRLIGATIGLLTVCVWPFVAIFVTAGAVRWVNFAIAAVLVMTVGAMAVHTRMGSVAYGLALPLVTLVFLAMVWRASLLAIRRGGVRWKDTFYRLEDLRASRF